ncbi:MAG TPA: hypothetical protein VFP22_06375, partial [Candidatus Limnocylindrales bacterium]|nr:hypothetical protein [Candidatus Limnocylindrales bacterium]
SQDEEPTSLPVAGYDQPPERLRAGGPRHPLAVALVIAAGFALAIWQPWASPTPRVSRGPTPAPGPSGVARGPAPTPDPPNQSETAGPVVYTSITDNEWTVVALLSPAAPASTEEPAGQHVPAWSASGPFLVLQQGVVPALAPIEDAGDAAKDASALCVSTAVPRDRTVVPVPAGRVGYLGVTIPGELPRASVSASVLSGPGGAMTRSVSPTIELAGMRTAARYIIPSTGPGGAILFAGSPPGPMPSGVYRFTVESPGAGSRYLYACITP